MYAALNKQQTKEPEWQKDKKRYLVHVRGASAWSLFLLTVGFHAVCGEHEFTAVWVGFIFWEIFPWGLHWNETEFLPAGGDWLLLRSEGLRLFSEFKAFVKDPSAKLIGFCSHFLTRSSLTPSFCRRLFVTNSKCFPRRFEVLFFSFIF